MPEYLSILRELSIYSIYLLFLLVIFLLILKGVIKHKEFKILYYFWLPIAVITQILMTFYRTYFDTSNLPIMNIYLSLEFIILLYVLLLVREKVKGIPINYFTFSVLVIVEITTHIFYKFDSIHNAAMLYIAVVYFQFAVSFIDLNNTEKFYKEFYSLFHISVFIKAFGYSYFLIYQTDFRFPLSIFSVLNILTQIMLAYTLLIYYQQGKD